MPPRPSTRPNPGSVPAPPSPPIETITDSIYPLPSPTTSEDPLFSASEPLNADLPGPSSTFIPVQPSPPLPELRNRPFPPDDLDSDSSDEDEILAQLPIYLSPSLHPNLNLFQYPLNHRSLTVPTWAKDRDKRISARVKEGVGRVEVEIPVDAGTDVWRDDRARDLGFVTDVGGVNGDEAVEGGYGFGGRGLENGNGPEKEKEKDKEKRKGRRARKEEKWGDKMRFRSEVVPNATGYYSGIVHDGAVHLHPITKLLQLRTSLSYLDEHDVRVREGGSRREVNGDAKDGEKEEKKPRANGGSATAPGRPVTIREEEDNDGSGSIQDFRNKMRSMVQREEEDKWVPYEWKDGDDPTVLQQMETLLVSEEKRVQLECRTRGLDYLNKA